MFQHRLNEHVTRKTYFDWLLLSFLAGTINTGGYLSCNRFVSHITGFATLAGISFETGHLWDAIGALLAPVFFLLGVVVSGYLTEKKISYRIDGQKYAPVMGVVAALLGIVVIGGYFDLFGLFGKVADTQNDVLLMACLCGACGLQNGAITSASGFTIRTTHLTGLTTDLGLGLVRSEVRELSPVERAKERRANLFRMGTIFSFTGGAIAGAFVFMTFQYNGFLLPMVLAIYFAYTAKKSAQPPQS